MSDTTVQTDTIEGIDDFLPMAGAEAVVTAGADAAEKPNLFSRADSVDMDFLDPDATDEEEKEIVIPVLDENETDPEKIAAQEKLIAEATAAKAAAESKPAEKGAADSVIDELDNEFLSDEEKEAKDKKPTTANSGNMVKALSSLIESGTLLAFDDGKDLNDYSKKDLEELITMNIEEKEKAIREQTPKEFFDALPPELQYAAKHVAANGGANMKDVFKALARSEEIKELDVTNEDHQEMIARQYLQATGFGSGDDALVEDQIQEWVEAGSIEKKAGQFKPKLDKMQEKTLEADLAKQEETKQRQVEQKDAYMKNIFETLKPAELNGVKIDTKRQNMLWNELTTVKYESMGGRPTNLLGKLLEDYQFGEEPRYDLIAETLWLLQDPEDYKANIRQSAVNDTVKDTVKTLKTEEGRKLKSTPSKEEDDDTSRKTTSKNTLKRKPKNIFAKK